MEPPDTASELRLNTTFRARISISSNKTNFKQVNCSNSYTRKSKPDERFAAWRCFDRSHERLMEYPRNAIWYWRGRRKTKNTAWTRSDKIFLHTVWIRRAYLRFPWYPVLWNIPVVEQRSSIGAFNEEGGKNPFVLGLHTRTKDLTKKTTTIPYKKELFHSNIIVVNQVDSLSLIHCQKVEEDFLPDNNGELESSQKAALRIKGQDLDFFSASGDRYGLANHRDSNIVVAFHLLFGANIHTHRRSSRWVSRNHPSFCCSPCIDCYLPNVLWFGAQWDALVTRFRLPVPHVLRPLVHLFVLQPSTFPLIDSMKGI